MALNQPAPYRLTGILKDHSQSINALSFSPDGLMLATGGDDGLVLIYCLSTTTNNWTQKFRFQAIGAITCIVWNPRFEAVLFVGNRNGDIHVIRLSRVWNPWASAYRQTSIVWRFSRRSSVQCLSINQKGNMVAIAHGSSVSLMKQGTPSAFDNIAIVPDPPVFPEVEEQLPRPIARSLHFLDEEDLLIVTYLQHGIVAWHVHTLKLRWQIRPRTCRIGTSSLSTDSAMLVVTNLYDGLDYYSVPNRRWVNTVVHPQGENVCIPIEHIHNGSDLLIGGSLGYARIVHKATEDITALLEHDDNLVQAIAYRRRRPKAWWGRGYADQIATAVSEGGSHNEVRIWSGSEDPRDTLAKFLAEFMSALRTFFPSKRDVAVAFFTIGAAALIAAFAREDRTPRALFWLVDFVLHVGWLVMEFVVQVYRYSYVWARDMVYLATSSSEGTMNLEHDIVEDSGFVEKVSPYRMQTVTAG